MWLNLLFKKKWPQYISLHFQFFFVLFCFYVKDELTGLLRSCWLEQNPGSRFCSQFSFTLNSHHHHLFGLSWPSVNMCNVNCFQKLKRDLSASATCYPAFLTVCIIDSFHYSVGKLLLGAYYVQDTRSAGMGIKLGLHFLQISAALLILGGNK